jgi:hypothetical protein
MALSLSPITARLASLFGAILVSWLLIFVGPVSAAQTAPSKAPYFQVELKDAAPMQGKIIQDVYVNCAGTSCFAPRANSSQKGFCASISRQFGEVKEFTAAGQLFDAKQLAKCNGKSVSDTAQK